MTGDYSRDGLITKEQAFINARRALDMARERRDRDRARGVLAPQVEFILRRLERQQLTEPAGDDTDADALLLHIAGQWTSRTTPHTSLNQLAKATGLGHAALRDALAHLTAISEVQLCRGNPPTSVDPMTIIKGTFEIIADWHLINQRRPRPEPRTSPQAEQARNAPGPARPAVGAQSPARRSVSVDVRADRSSPNLEGTPDSPRRDLAALHLGVSPSRAVPAAGPQHSGICFRRGPDPATIDMPYAAQSHPNGVLVSEDPIYENPDAQLARRVAALERLAETQDILDRTEALAVRQRQQVEQSRTQLLEKISRTQDEHGAALAQHGEMLTEILTLLRSTNGPAR
ncbi:hypothetical protein ACFWBC_37660 [Streptomyces sp. NPDC059985]|uniref:hypothetical protein n=1 Tax=Streptomyces sp. NPDC059985 TaxID=3347025 RepID=UPI0036BD8530